MNITSSDKFCDGKYPYKKHMKDEEYEEQKAKLQVELLKAQRWAKETGQKIVALYEGRDAAGKALARGVYFTRVESASASFETARKITILK